MLIPSLLLSRDQDRVSIKTGCFYPKLNNFTLDVKIFHPVQVQTLGWRGFICFIDHSPFKTIWKCEIEVLSLITLDCLSFLLPQIRSDYPILGYFTLKWKHCIMFRLRSCYWQCGRFLGGATGPVSARVFEIKEETLISLYLVENWA